MILVARLQDSFAFHEDAKTRVTVGMPVLAYHSYVYSAPAFVSGDSQGFLVSRFWAGGI